MVYIAPKVAATLTKVKPVAPVPPDPFAQLTPGQIAGQVNSQLPALAPMTTKAAQGVVGSELTPYTAAIQAQLKQTDNALNGYTSGLVGAVKGVDYAAPYTGAEQQQAAVDAALRDSLANAGSSTADDLRARLAQIGSPDVSGAAADAVAARGSAAGTTQQAQGSAALSNLIANEASNVAYGKKAVNIARDTGLQNLGTANSQAQTLIGNEAAALEQQIPTLIQNSKTRSDSRAAARANLTSTFAGQNLTRAIAKAAHLADLTKADSAAAPHPDATLSRADGYQVDQYGNPLGTTYNANGTVKAAAAVTPLPGDTVSSNGFVTKTPKPAAAAKPTTQHLSTAASGRFGYEVDTTGKEILTNGQRTPYPKASGTKTGSSTTGPYNHMVSLARSYVKTSTLTLGGKTIGTPTASVPLPQAYNNLLDYAVGAGVKPAAAKRLALQALGAAGYQTGVGVGVTP